MALPISDELQRVFTPNEVVSRRTFWFIVVAWFCVWLAYWTAARPAIFPSPVDVLNALPDLWWQDGLGQELFTSLLVSLQALALSTAIALPLAYLSQTPVVRPLAEWLAELRFLSPAIFFTILLFMASSGHMVKVLMLALGEAFFLVTTMMDVVQAIPAERYDDVRTLRMSEWQGVWYVVVRGTLDQAITAVRDNAAMGWSMLMMVEGIVRSEGGVGVLLLNQSKYLNFSQVYAIAAAICLVGIGQDYALGVVRRLACPWVNGGSR